MVPSTYQRTLHLSDAQADLEIRPEAKVSGFSATERAGVRAKVGSISMFLSIYLSRYRRPMKLVRKLAVVKIRVFFFSNYILILYKNEK